MGPVVNPRRRGTPLKIEHALEHAVGDRLGDAAGLRALVLLALLRRALLVHLLDRLGRGGGLPDALQGRLARLAGLRGHLAALGVPSPGSRLAPWRRACPRASPPRAPPRPASYHPRDAAPSCRGQRGARALSPWRRGDRQTAARRSGLEDESRGTSPRGRAHREGSRRSARRGRRSPKTRRPPTRTSSSGESCATRAGEPESERRAGRRPPPSRTQLDNGDDRDARPSRDAHIVIVVKRVRAKML